MIADPPTDLPTVRMLDDVAEWDGVAADWARSHGSVRAQLKFAGEQVAHTAFIHNQHDEVNRLAADLESDAAAGDGEKCGRAPSRGGAATGDSPAVAGTNDESAFEQRGHYCDALGRSKNLFGDTFISSGHNFVNHGSSSINAVRSLGFLSPHRKGEG